MGAKQTMENMEIKKVLVTGSEGYIGSVLVNKLVRQGYKVAGMDTCYYSEVPKNKKYQFLKHDIRDIDTLDLKRFDTIIHLAALSNDPMGEIDSSLTNDINYTSTVKLAKKAKKQGVKRFLFSSSCSIYGIAKTGGVDETSEVNPLTAYAKSKINSERELKKLASKTFCVGILRNSTVYGYSPRFRDDLVVNNLTASALSTNTIRIMSDGTPWRPLIDVRDLSDIFIEFLKMDSKKISGDIFNIGFNKNNFQVKDIVDLIKKELPQCDIIYTGEHGKDSRSYKVNFNKFRSTFPHTLQKWPMKKSIKDLIKKLKQIKYNKAHFENKTYTRLAGLNKIILQNKINNSLFWIK